jgi:hypothetical protein
MVDTIKHFIDVFCLIEQKSVNGFRILKKITLYSKFQFQNLFIFQSASKMVSYHVSLEINLTHFGLGDDTP